MTHETYQRERMRAVQISGLLARMLSEDAQDLFEQYCTIYEKMVQYEIQQAQTA